MADGLSGCLPDLFLWVEVWAGDRKEHGLQTRVLAEDLLHGRAAMPMGTIPEEQDGFVRVGLEDLHQVLG